MQASLLLCILDQLALASKALAATPTCTPSPIVDFTVGNGDFNNYAVVVGTPTTNEPPWYTGTLTAASIDFESDGTTGTGPGNQRHGQGFA